MVKNKHGKLTRVLRRVATGVCSLMLLGGLSSVSAVTIESAEWMDPYLETALEWGVIKPDENDLVDGFKELTRADFVAMVNRAFGYTEVGENPYSDVPDHAWYAEDICIAREAGYFKGTSDTTASPNDLVTREQAAVMLGRNLRLEGVSGEVMEFTDSRDIGYWSRSLVQQAAQLGIIQGYDDGRFGPKDTLSQGQMATFLVRALGTRIQEPGEVSNVGAYTHLTITSPNVTLKNTTITGNLYLAGGVGLEDVVLENVTVEGSIIVAGGGVAQEGENSVILRNVTAKELVVDSLTGQNVSIRAEGLTSIDYTDVRTSSYLEDVTGDGLGLKKIDFDALPSSTLNLAGNIKDVLNLTNGSILTLAQGTAATITVDERATDTTLNVNTSAVLKNLNLDAGAKVQGSGDVENLTVAATDSSTTMLPDTITVRPGLTADINGDKMDSEAAAESSQEPRILSGYPKAKEVAAKSADLTFKANKKGTIYWAVTALSDGSVGESELVNGASGNSKIVKSGKVSVTASNTEVTAKLSGLTSNESYYISAVLEDNRGMRSLVKVAAFNTPDDTVPAFGTGYPTTILTEDSQGNIVLQSQVVASKDCRLYYMLLPQGSTAPTANDFKTATATSNLGYGWEDLRKNTLTLLPKINRSGLKEQTKYDLYLWLTDLDNGKSSAVKKMQVETPDKTPPVIQQLTVTDIKPTSIQMTFSMDEPGTFYWAIVKEGVQFFSDDIENTLESKNTKSAKMQIETGLGALKKGSQTAAKGSTNYSFTISGLEAQTAYHLYYVAKDKAGIYNVYTELLVPPMQVNTEDNQPPTVSQEFSNDSAEDGAKPEPYPNTTIDIIFSERVKGVRTENGKKVHSDFYKMYTEGDMEGLANALRHHIRLYKVPLSGAITEVPVRGEEINEETWVIDYHNVQVTMDSGKMYITFPYNDDLSKSALNLQSGVTYYFEVSGIKDTSNSENAMQPTVVQLERFTTVDAKIQFSPGSEKGTILLDSSDPTNTVTKTFDMNFHLSPITASGVDDGVLWDLLFWSDSNFEFELYYREVGDDVWKQVNPSCLTETYAYDPDAVAKFNTTVQNPRLGVSVGTSLLSKSDDELNYEALQDLKKDREYGIIVTKYGSSDRKEIDNWSGTVAIDIMAVSGDFASLRNINKHLTPDDYEAQKETNLAVKEINDPLKEYTVSYTFRDKAAPTFIEGYPNFTPGDGNVSMDIMLSRDKTKYYYLIAEAGTLPTVFKGTDGVEYDSGQTGWFEKLPTSGLDLEKYYGEVGPNATKPGNAQITNPTVSEETEKYWIGYGEYNGGVVNVIRDSSNGKSLKADTDYVVYFVLEGDSAEAVSDVYAFGFHTKKVVRPILSVTMTSYSSASISADREANVKYMMMISGQEGEMYKRTMASCWSDEAAALYELDDDQIKKYKEMTILEAMQELYTKPNANTSSGSVFDLFATTIFHTEMESLFSSASTNGSSIVLVKEANLKADNFVYEVTSKETMAVMQEGDQRYWLVVMGKSPLGSGYAFSAGSFLYYMDDKPPQVSVLSVSVDTDFAQNFGTASSKSYTGELRITFSRALYYKKTDKKYQQVVDKNLNKMPTENADNYISSTLLLSSSAGTIQPQHDDRTNEIPSCETLLIKFTMKDGTSISFDSMLSNRYGITGQSALTINMRLVKNSYGYFQPQFYIPDTLTTYWGNVKSEVH